MSVSQAYSTGISPSEAPRDSWGLSQMMGRLVEISGHRAAANLTVAFGLVLEAQTEHVNNFGTLASCI